MSEQNPHDILQRAAAARKQAEQRREDKNHANRETQQRVREAEAQRLQEISLLLEEKNRAQGELAAELALLEQVSDDLRDDSFLDTLEDVQDALTTLNKEISDLEQERKRLTPPTPEPESISAPSPKEAEAERREKLDAAIIFMNIARDFLKEGIDTALTREDSINDIQREIKIFETSRKNKNSQLLQKLASLFAALPEDKKAQILSLTKEDGVKFNLDSRRISEMTPSQLISSAGQIEKWFSHWNTQVTPSMIPFLDTPLRDPLAFPRSHALNELTRDSEEHDRLLNTEAGLFAQRARDNDTFLTRFLLILEDSRGAKADAILLLKLARQTDRTLAGLLDTVHSYKEQIGYLLLNANSDLVKKYQATPFAKMSFDS